MAILDSIPGLSVWINVDGQPATEYNDPDDEAQGMDLDGFDVPANSHSQRVPYMIKYIEAKPGAPFSFCISKDNHFHRPSHHVAHQVTVDGQKYTRRHHEREDRKAIQERQAAFTSYGGIKFGNPTDGYKEHSFMFSPVEIVENDGISSRDLLKQMDLVKHCGVLKIALFHMRESTALSRHLSRNRPHGSDGVEKIAEKALKGRAVDCKTSYANSGRVTERMLVHGWHNDAKKRPFAVFEFRYRTKEGLIKEAIIPRPNVTQEIDNMTEAEVRQRLAEVLEQNKQAAAREKREGSIEITSEREIKPRGNGAARIKQQVEDGNPVEREGHTAGAIKREAPMTDDEFMLAGRYKARRLDNGRVEVDLTDD